MGVSRGAQRHPLRLVDFGDRVIETTLGGSWAGMVPCLTPSGHEPGRKRRSSRPRSPRCGRWRAGQPFGRFIAWIGMLALAAVSCSLPVAAAGGTGPRVAVGLEVLVTQHLDLIQGRRLAVLVAATSLNARLEHAIDVLAAHATVQRIFTGERFFRSTMQLSPDQERCDALTQAPVVEMLDPLRKPDRSSFAGCDLVVIDVQDIGLRFFSYLTLLAQFLDAAREARVPVLILDRPNPICGSTVSGPVLEVSFRSQFGVYPIPLVHGMTFGELGLMFNKAFGLGAKLTVIGMENYRRAMGFEDTGRHWAMPSDHLPEASSPRYYAMTGFLGEMGIVSNGVGYTRPFHYVLAPWIDGERLATELNSMRLAGVRFLPATVKPFYGLFQGRATPGIEVVVLEPRRFDPVLVGVAILRGLVGLYPDRMPLEHPSIREGLDTLLGGPAVRESLARRVPIESIWRSWQPALRQFGELRRRFLIYPE